MSEKKTEGGGVVWRLSNKREECFNVAGKSAKIARELLRGSMF